MDELEGWAKVNFKQQLSAEWSMHRPHLARLVKHGDLVARSRPDERHRACRAEELGHPKPVPTARVWLTRHREPQVPTSDAAVPDLKVEWRDDGVVLAGFRGTRGLGASPHDRGGNARDG